MGNGFDTGQLDDFTRDLIDLAVNKMPKETKKHLKKESTKLSKVQKQTFKSLGIGEQGFTEKDILKSMKSGKVYKHNGSLASRAYASHNLAHLLDKGFIHKGGRDKKGKETFIPGYDFIKKAEDSFESTYYSDTEAFIDELIDKGLR